MAPGRPAADIRAAGAVLWRLRRRRVEVALVHRPRYDDWSLPKGRLEPGETALAGAVREVWEETGAQMAVSRRLDPVRYEVKGGRKEVTYWLGRHLGGEFAPGDEVDDLEWLPVAQARARATRAAEAALIGEVERLPLPEAVVVLVRHTRAGRRSQWAGADAERPLDAVGRLQADRLVPFLQAFRPTRLVSAEPLRCRQTLAPAAAAAGLPVGVDAALGDAAFRRSPAETERAVSALARHGQVTVVASQGDAIPGTLDRLWPRRSGAATAKGAAWVLSFVDGAVLSADHYPDASD